MRVSGAWLIYIKIGKLPTAFRLLVSLAFFLFSSLFAAERLPLTVYSSADGLLSSVIHHIARDSTAHSVFA